MRIFMWYDENEIITLLLLNISKQEEKHLLLDVCLTFVARIIV